MISKKSRKVVAALLIGATVCASGTFAYFNSKADLTNIDGVEDDAVQKLAITNGKVKISGKMATASIDGLNSMWSYSVAAVSSEKLYNALVDSGATDLQKNTLRNALVLSNAGTADLNFINTHRSPDIAYGTIQSVDTGKVDGLGNTIYEDKITTQTKLDNDTTGKGGISRAKIGAPVGEYAILARPGDAFALGTDGVGAEGLDGTNTGLTIVNESNLTTKLGMRLNISEADATKAQQQAALDALENIGAKVYVKVTSLAKDASGNDIATTPTTLDNWKGFDLSDFLDVDGKPITYQILNMAGDVNGAKQDSFKVDFRVELPLMTGNKKQGLSSLKDADGTAVDPFDITNMFEFVATQENNPGWTQAGTDPAAGKAFTNTGDKLGEGVADKDVDVADPNDIK